MDRASQSPRWIRSSNRDPMWPVSGQTQRRICKHAFEHIHTTLTWCVCVSLWSHLTGPADRGLSEVKLTYLPPSARAVDTGHVRAQWRLNWTESNQIDGSWRAGTHRRVQTSRKMTREFIRSWSFTHFIFVQGPGGMERIHCRRGRRTQRKRWKCRSPVTGSRKKST